MNVIFVGTGGGRVNLILQKRRTGGFVIFSKSANIYVDPGPGALVYSRKMGIDLGKIDILFASHVHIDHVNDIGVIVEGMSHFGIKKRGIFIGSKYVINGKPGDVPAVSKYHLGKLSRYIVASPGEEAHLDTGKGEVFFRFTKTKHDEPTAVGFILRADGVSVGYTSDTEYFPGISKQYYGVDLLIVNCLKPEKDAYPGHMTTKDAFKLISKAKPKKAVLTHLGMRLLKAHPGRIARDMTTRLGIPVISAKDGLDIKV